MDKINITPILKKYKYLHEKSNKDNWRVDTVQHWTVGAEEALSVGNFNAHDYTTPRFSCNFPDLGPNRREVGGHYEIKPNEMRKIITKSMEKLLKLNNLLFNYWLGHADCKEEVLKLLDEGRKDDINTSAIHITIAMTSKARFNSWLNAEIKKLK